MIRLSLVPMLVGLICCHSVLADEAGLARLESARALWQSTQSGDYRYSYQKYCECYRSEPPTTVVMVRNGQVSQVFHLYADSDRQVPAREGSNGLYWTVEDLFSKLDAAYAREAVVRAEYHPSLGYPVSLYIDYDTGFTGDETDLRLSGFEQL